MRIAQVTDLHLRWHQAGTSSVNARRSRDMADGLRQVLERIKSQRVDLLAITGDLLDAPLWLWENTWGFETDDVLSWRTAVEQDYRLVKQILDDSGLRYMVLPGNHDMDDMFWRVFDRNENILDIAGYRVVRFCDREADGHFPRRFMHERVMFDQMLQENHNLPQVHLQHYVIHPQLNHGYPHSYLEGEELTRRIVAHNGVRLCLSGHYHVGTDLLKQEQTVFSTGEAFCEYPHPWRVYDLSANDITVEKYALFDGPLAPRPVVFLDRDGVINDLASYRQGPEMMRLIPGSAQAIAKLREAGFAVVGITSQSAVGMGYVTQGVVHSVHDKMHRLLMEESGAWLDAIYYSTAAGLGAILPSYADLSLSKPNPHNLFKAQRLLNLDLSRGWMVGDRLADIQTGRNAGVETILVRTGMGKNVVAMSAEELGEVTVADDLAAAVEIILSRKG